MASTGSNSQASGANGGLSAAQKLMQKHDEAHKVTIEDVPDEEDVTPHPHPSSTNVLESTDEAASAPGWAVPMTAKAAGKQKAAPEGKENVPFVNTQSETAFPSLGPSSNAKAASAPIWGAKKTASNGNGVATNGSSTPKSGMNTPPVAQSAPRGASQSLAGQVSGPSYSFEPKELPRSATKKPLPDILRDINKKYRTNLTQTTGERGTIKISESSAQVPDTRKRQAFKELGNQITIKVSINRYLRWSQANTPPVLCASRNPPIRESPHHWKTRIYYKVDSRDVRRACPNAQDGGCTRSYG